MALNPFFSQGTASEQRLVQDLINEHLQFHGVEVTYIPRKFVNRKTIIEEIQTSKFDDNFSIEAYVNTFEGYGGAGDIMTKFGVSIRDELILTLSKERFEDFVAPFMAALDDGTDTSIMPASTRPREGDLVYFPLGQRLFEVKFVEHEDPFYQLGKNYVYQLKCELFEYEDEVIDTSIEMIDSQVQDCINDAITKLEELGAEIVDISLPHTEYAVSTYYIIATAEASANLARFDAVRYGNRALDCENINEHYVKSRSEGFGAEVKRRIILGTYVLSSGYNDAYYVKAQKVRTLIRDDFKNAFDKVDAIISPTSPTPAFKIGQMSKDPLKMYLADIFTIAANLSGICGISTPCGFVSSNEGTSLPVGLQILGPPMKESTILRVSDAYEQATDWLAKKPSN